MVKLLARFFLWLLGIAIPVFIAACYGMPYRYSKQGRVIDRLSLAGIQGIEVRCLRAGQEQSSTQTWDQGQFSLDYDLPCDELHVTDVDGAANGGAYQEKVVPFCEACAEIVVELDRAP